MAELLRTKLHIPQQPPTLLHRPALLERLDAGLQARLTVITAPAGFGKSTLAAAWLHESAQIAATRPAPQIGWFAIDTGDNDPKRFLAYCMAALAVVLPAAGNPAAEVEPLLIPLINQLTTVDQHRILVLDDYHLIENEAIDHALTFLLEHAPPTLHICITSRVDPNLPLHRWRARQQMTELRARDLRFTVAESAQLFREKLALSLTEGDLQALNQHTEGWITALQMAGQSLQGRSAAEIHTFVHGFRGSHRFVLDYLIEEVLHHQPPALQNFLLHTAILERLCAPLCDFLLAAADPVSQDTTQENATQLSAQKPFAPFSTPASPTQQILEALEAKNLFTFALDEERRWFRYHHLFADLLRLHLQSRQPTIVPQLHRRAAEWYAAEGLIEEAIDHAIQGDATALAAEWTAQIATSLLQRGELLTLKRAISKLPSHYVTEDYRLALTQAWAATAVMEHQDPEPDFELLTKLLKNVKEVDEARRADLLAQVLVMRTTWAVSLNQIDDALHYGREALAQLTTDAMVMRNLITLQLGNAHRVRGDFQTAIEQYQTICTQGTAVNDALIIYITHHQCARLYRLQGRLDTAERLCDHAIALNQQLHEPTLLVGLAHVGKAEVLWERWDLGAALAHAEQAVEVCRLAGMTEGVAFAYHLLARIHFAQGAPTAAEEAITAAEPYLQNIKEADGIQWDRLYGLRYAMLRQREEKATNDTLLPDLAFLQVQLDHAQSAIQTDMMAADLRCELVIAVAQASLLLDQPTATLQLLEDARYWDGEQSTLFTLDRTLLRAVAHQLLGEDNAATTALNTALDTAAQQGQQRPFLELGGLLQSLLPQFDATVATRYSSFAATVATQVAPTRQVEPSSGLHTDQSADTTMATPSTEVLVETFSDRELEVLTLIADGKRNQEIADTLVVSINTVRYHTKNIYGKLNVNNRTQAVAKAQQLGLL